jgi:predicted ATPase/DNA-binding winged helix-turn-helix (wHTH) protein
MAAEICRFEDFELDPGTYQLHRNGSRVRLERIPFELLCILVERRGELVSREEIAERIWGKGVFIDSENGINTAIRKIRRALGDNADAPRLVVTIRARGYRFVASLREADAPTAKELLAASPAAPSHQHVSDQFAVEDGGVQTFKGIERPVQLYQVIQPSVARRGVRTYSSARALTPFVGREDELRLLLGRWERTREGEGQAVLIVGEPGIGKSRLVEELRARITPHPHLWIECAGEQFFTNTPFHAVVEVLKQALGWSGNETNEQRLDLLERSLEMAGLKLDDSVPLVAEMLNLALPEEYPPLMLPPEHRRRRLIATLAGWVFGAAKAQPLMLVMEDLHWLDPSTLELTETLVEQGATAPLMLLCTARPEFSTRWPMRAHHAQISLNRLNDRETREMVAGLAARAALSKNVIDTVVKRADGVPLFAEELTRLILEGDGRSAAREIPGTLRDSLNARIDRLGPAKQVAQVAAVIGREFSYELLQAVLQMPEDELQSGLAKLADAEVIYARGIAPDASYQFKHALIRDAAYEALLKTRRQELHRRIANVVDRSFPEIAAARPELLAHHYSEAGLSAQAIPCWQRAGQRAVERSAHVEAINHLNRGLELLKPLAGTSEHAAEELTLQVTLGVPLGIIKGYASPEVKTVYERARELCHQVGETPHLCPVLWALWRLHHVRAEFQEARELGEELLVLAQRHQDHDFLLQAHHALWTTLILLGEFTLAREHLEQGMFLYDPQQHRSHAFLYGGHDPGACCRVQRGYVLWYLGYPEQALKSAQESIILAQELSHPYTVVMSLEGATMIHQFCRDIRATQERAETVLAFARDGGFPAYSAMAILYRGWALAEQGLEKEGLTELRQGMAAYRATGAGLGLPYQLARMAEVYARTGQVQEGLSALAEALVATDKTGDRRWVAELYRLKGELTLQSKSEGREGAEEYFLRAIGIARGQQAKSFELRATMSLARLLANQGRRDEAHTMLAEVYGWFTEGFDTADLKGAKALLDELNIV